MNLAKEVINRLKDQQISLQGFFVLIFFFGKGKMMEKKHWCQAIRVRCTIELSLLASMFKMEMSLKPSYKL